jgi:hypothetical protein
MDLRPRVIRHSDGLRAVRGQSYSIVWIPLLGSEHTGSFNSGLLNTGDFNAGFLNTGFANSGAVIRAVSIRAP